MTLVTIVVGLLSVLGSCHFTVNTHVQSSNLNGHRVTVHSSGTSCEVWVKHGGNPATRLNYIPHNGIATWVFPSSYTVSLDDNTFIWTTCHDALLIDFMFLGTSQGYKMWGTDNAHGWCLSSDQDDAAAFNDQLANVVDGCFSLFLATSTGTVYGYQWRPEFWEHDRRMLQAAEAANLPSTADVEACLDDSSRSEEECDDLADQIISFSIEHAEGFMPAPQFPITDEEEVELSSDVNTLESTTEVRRLLKKANKRLLKL